MSTTPSTLVSAGAPATPAAPATPPAPPAAQAPAAGADLKAINDRLAALEAENGDLKRTAQFWHEKANGKPPAAPKPEKVDEPEVDLLDVITTKGVKGLVEVLKREKIITRDEAEGLVNSKASQVTTEAQLIKDNPELSDKDSEFFKVTAQHYGQLKEKGVPEEMAMQLAVERTELRLMKDGKRKTPAQVKDDEKAERERDRRARIAAQSGDRGGRPPAESEEDEELNDNQLHIVRSMLVGQPGDDGKPMNEEQAVAKYKARAKKGVSMKGGGR